VLSKEKFEADRKSIEAQGIADYQRTVSQGLNELLLRWKGIEATEKLANSSNSKIVVIGGKDGMPLIMNAEK
jgi:prohibitin 1